MQQAIHEWILVKEGMVAEDAVINLDAWAECLVERDDASVWGVSYSQSEATGHDHDRAGAQYHGDARKSDIPTTGVSALGFSYEWSGRLVRGMVAKSGYAALYNITLEEVFAKWVADEILEFLEFDTGDEQQFLEEVSA